MGSARLLHELATEARLLGATAAVVDADQHRDRYGVVEQNASGRLEFIMAGAIQLSKRDPIWRFFLVMTAALSCVGGRASISPALSFARALPSQNAVSTRKVTM